ncbi:EAL domain-containing protein [Lysobacter korlensis]|uniref:EAL domain-containing protein n=1 Tax=Lysobacter korlensis TaxID=553636 RepID=A0ABV6RJ17_9GAMM
MEASKDSDGFAQDPQEPPEQGWNHWQAGLWSLLALLAGLALSVWLAQMQQQRVDERRRQGLEQVANDTHAALRDRIEEAALLLRGLQTIYATSQSVEPDEFAASFTNLEPQTRFPSLQAFAYAQRERRDGRDFFPVVLVAPLPENERLLGLDVTSQPENLKALLGSAATNRPALSAPFPLLQAAPGQGRSPGVVLRLPVYRSGPPPVTPAQRLERLQGSLAVSFLVNDLIANAVPAQSRQLLHLQVTDVTSERSQPLYDSHPAAHDPVAFDWQRSVEMDVGGRTWQLDMHPLEHAVARLDWTQSLLLPGICASVLFALLVGSLVSTRQRALSLGERMSRRYRASEARFRALNDLLPALVLLARSRDGMVMYANQAAQLRLGRHVRTLALADLFDEDEQRAQLRRSDHPGCSNAEALLRSANGDRFWASVSIAPVQLDDEQQLLMVASDISEQRQLTELLGYQATHDALTELLNRREFERRVDHVLAGIAAGAPPCALFFIDLDQFKLINDTSGHAAGDQLLVQLAGVMRDQLRGGDVLARLGGDEFGVLATSVEDLEGAKLVAGRLREAVDAYAFIWEQRSYTISASIGGVMVEHAEANPKELFAQADTACYLAKEAGRNRVHFYREQDDEAARRRNEMQWAHRLRWAIDENRFLLQYQEVWPLALDLDAGARIELLLRFREENGQIVAPGAFIPAAERYGLMPMIDRWVIEAVLGNFDRLHPSGTSLQLATINLSGASIEDEALSSLILELLQRHAVDPRRVCFEITETVAVRSFAQVTRFIEPLRAVGCRIALDDFGAGMSSFGYLKSLPLDIIKIDGSFIRDLTHDSMSRAIVRAVTDIGHERGFKIVAEWVTGYAIADALAEIGVDYAQGFGLHRPQTVVFQRES